MDQYHLAPQVRYRAGREDSKGHVTTSSSLDGDLGYHTPAWTTMDAAKDTRTPQKLVLCFDGTGNRFRGDDSDSNILKIFRCLDRESGGQCIYLGSIL